MDAEHIDLRECVDHSLHVERRLDVGSTFTTTPEIARLATVDLRLDLVPGGERRYHLHLAFHSDARAYCSRCSEPFELALDDSFDLTLVPGPPPAGSEGDAEMDVQAIDIAYYGGDQLDVRALVEEQIHLALPMRLLCDESCRGLCLRCGCNLNRQRCSCTTDAVHPAFESLSGLLD